MFKRRASILLSGTMLGASFLLAAPALADDAQTEQLQKQINALQKQLQSLQSQVTETKKEAKAAQQRAESAPPPNAPAGLYNAAPPPGPSPVIGKAPSWISGITISFAGSFIEGATVWRQHNEVSSWRQRSAFRPDPVPEFAALHMRTNGGRVRSRAASPSR